ncbi:hypothetical protein FHL15_003622 [Xylaria flabelliformis]|uniref:Uncharacterized protein n=1 Tax=Xylaria flabelliformis TaxID=2512241 RepID=A0A553I673_9PEZI|nr:hypothetical protein FHL15_003622 [Xylaria flabelliformis]
MSPSAGDIITIIGVPLAVLGVLPILYNTLATLAALSKIKRMLRHGKLTALTRSDIINKVIEVELPRYAVQPWDRFASKEYWQISRQPSSIPGGSWTTFNWKTNTIGIKTQRVEYADQLRQPQVEVEFHELVAYLLDLGAIPDAHGWRLLRSTGLWTPMGCALMKSPDSTSVAMAIAPLDDSDGHLSLKVSWKPSWTTRDASTLPPYWIRLPPPPITESDESPATASTSQEGPQPEETSDAGKNQEELGDDKKLSSPKQSLDSIQKQADRNARLPITCQFSVDGLQSALSQEQGPPMSTVNVHSLHMEHLRVSSHKMNGKWFASAATAYGTTSQTVLWNYKIPDEILAFARRDTVPCGVLELLGVVDDSMTPQWATKHDDHMQDHESFVRSSQEHRIALAAEARMDPAQRQIAIRQRTEREMMQRMNEMRDRSRRGAQRRETRRHEALQSPKWSTSLVAEHNLNWLRGRKVVDAEFALREVVGMLLHRMVLDGEFASAICEMLDVWKAWADNGGMRNTDLDILEVRQETFAQASLLVALVKDATGAHEGTLTMDLQECLRMWRVVRLGSTSSA